MEPETNPLTIQSLPIIIYSNNNCVENSIRNFLNHLLFSESKQSLDLSKLDYLHPKLSTFFSSNAKNLTTCYDEYQIAILEAYNDFRREMIKMAETMESITKAQRIHLGQELAFNLDNPKASTIGTAAFLAFILIKNWVNEERVKKFVLVNEYGPPICTRETKTTPDEEVEINMDECRKPLNTEKLVSFYKDLAIPYFNELMDLINNGLHHEIKFVKTLTIIEADKDGFFGDVYVKPVFQLNEEYIMLQFISRFGSKTTKKDRKRGMFREGGHSIFDTTTNKSMSERIYKWKDVKNDLLKEVKWFSVRIF